MDNRKIIKEIISILKNSSINSIEDLQSLILHKNKLLSAQNYAWIGDVANLIKRLYYDAENHISDIDGQIFLIDKLKSYNYEKIMKYSCIFPDRTILSSGDFFYLDKPEYAYIDIDFFKKLFWCKDLLLEGLVHISPFYLRTDIEEGTADYDNCIVEQLDLPHKNEKKIAELDDCGIGKYKDNGSVKKIYLNMPWLKNACVDDYIDIVNKNKMQFELYNKCLSDISNITEDTSSFIDKFIKDYEEASIDIQIALEKKQSELKTKGIITAISLCLTVVPFFIPDTCLNTQIIASVLGGGTVREGLNIANVYSEKNLIGKDNPFWVLWKWKNESE